MVEYRRRGRAKRDLRDSSAFSLDFCPHNLQYCHLIMVKHLQMVLIVLSKIRPLVQRRLRLQLRARLRLLQASADLEIENF
jgi:hypothetical protein